MIDQIAPPTDASRRNYSSADVAGFPSSSTRHFPTQPKPPKEKPVPLTVADAVGRVRQLLAEINQGAVTNVRIDSLMGEINKGLKSPECDELLTVLRISGKAKSKAKAVEKVREMLNSQLEMHVKAQGFGMNG